MTPLEGSILKWEKICKDRRSVDNGMENCPLCKEFSECIGCPVNVKSGDGCSNTPYDNWCEHQYNVHDVAGGIRRRQKGCKICDELVQAELDFLRSLRK